MCFLSDEFMGHFWRRIVASLRKTAQAVVSDSTPEGKSQIQIDLHCSWLQSYPLLAIMGKCNVKGKNNDSEGSQNRTAAQLTFGRG
jgi:hypothetical protein